MILLKFTYYRLPNFDESTLTNPTSGYGQIGFGHNVKHVLLIKFKDGFDETNDDANKTFENIILQTCDFCELYIWDKYLLVRFHNQCTYEIIIFQIVGL